jgi:hypothetical protein
MGVGSEWAGVLLVMVMLGGDKLIFFRGFTTPPKRAITRGVSSPATNSSPATRIGVPLLSAIKSLYFSTYDSITVLSFLLDIN